MSVERLRAALAAYEGEVQHQPVPPPMPATDHMSDREAAKFWFKEWEYKRDEWNRGWIAARVLADEVRAVLDEIPRRPDPAVTRDY